MFRLCSHNKVSQGIVLDVEKIFLKRGFTKVELKQCPVFDDAWEVWVEGSSWMLQIAKLEGERDAELVKPANKHRQDALKNEYKDKIEQMKKNKDLH